MTNTLTLPTPFGPYKAEGAVAIVATLSGILLGAYYLYYIQKTTGYLIPKRPL